MIIHYLIPSIYYTSINKVLCDIGNILLWFQTVVLYVLHSSTHGFREVSGKQLLFELKPNTDSSLLWKGLVRVNCHKVSTCVCVWGGGGGGKLNVVKKKKKKKL